MVIALCKKVDICNLILGKKTISNAEIAKTYIKKELWNCEEEILVVLLSYLNYKS